MWKRSLSSLPSRGLQKCVDKKTPHAAACLPEALPSLASGAGAVRRASGLHSLVVRWQQHRAHDLQLSMCKRGGRELEALEASGCTLTAIVVSLGVGGGIVWALLRNQGMPAEGAEVELAKASEFAFLRWEGASAVFAYCGSRAGLQSTTLRIRLEDSKAIAVDALATQQLAGRSAPATTVVQLDSSLVAGLSKQLELVRPADAARRTGRLPRAAGGVLALRVADAHPPPEIRDGPVVTLELRPGVGMLDLYGSPGSFSLQDDSLLRKGELARQSGRFNPPDLYSGRQQHVRRALAALFEDPQDNLAIFVGGDRVLPAAAAEGGQDAINEHVQGWGGMPVLMRSLCQVLEGEGKDLLAALQRAQCGAAGGVPSLAPQLRAALQRNADITEPLHGSRAVQLLEAAFARGFWNLPADSSGMHSREREAERLAERARRELWVPGSNSRRELEEQLCKFLFRYRLGLAASKGSLHVHLVRPAGGPSGEQTLHKLGYAPLRGQSSGGDAPRLWYRLELALLELPLE